MPTGTGKTILIVFLTSLALEDRRRVLILVHTEELLDQTYARLSSVGITAGVVKRASDEFDRDVVVAQVQTISRGERLSRIPKDSFDMLIVDECHLANAASWQRVMRRFGRAWMVGLTATPFRGDGDSLAWAHFAGIRYANWQSVAYVYDIRKAVEDGNLVRPVLHEIQTGVSLDSVPVRTPADGGVKDFVTRKLANVIDNPQRNQAIVEAWLRTCRGTRTVAFCVTQSHALNLANAFRRAGVAAYRVRHGMHALQRDRIIRAHKAGSFEVLTNCTMLTHGYDDPSIGCVIMARPTLSKTLFMQCVGRGLRPARGKRQCHVIAAVDSCTRHRIAIARELVELELEMSRHANQEIGAAGGS